MEHRERVEPRSVALYPTQWRVIEHLASELAQRLGQGSNVSMALRQIVNEWAEDRVVDTVMATDNVSMLR